MSDYDYMEYDEHKAGLYLWQIASPFLILVGTVGSLISLVLLSKKSNRKFIPSVYLCVLSCADIIALNTGLLRYWIIYTFDIDIRELSDVSCRLNLWLLYTALDVSAWMLVVVTIERVISIYFPAKFKLICKRFTCTCTIIVIISTLGLINGHLLVLNGDYVEDIQSGNETVSVLHRCQYLTDDYEYFFNHYFVWIDFVVYSVLPSLILTTGNSAILFKYIKSKCRVYGSSVAPEVVAQQRLDRARNQITTMSITLVSLNTVFLVTTIPVSVYIIGYNTWYNEGDSYDLAVLSLMWPVTNIFAYANNAANFGLYVLTSAKFRSETKRLFGCKSINEHEKGPQGNNDNAIAVVNIRHVHVKSRDHIQAK